MNVKLVFEAHDGQDTHELAIERDVGAAPTPTGDGEDKGEGMAVQEAVTTLFDDVTQELDAAGLALPEEVQGPVLIQLTLALLNGTDELRLPAVFKEEGSTDDEATEEESSEETA